MRRVKLLARKKQVLDKHSLEIVISKVVFASEKNHTKVNRGLALWLFGRMPETNSKRA